MVLSAAFLAACGGGDGADESPEAGLLLTASAGASASADAAETLACVAGSPRTGTSDREQLLALICAAYPGVEFDPECSETLPDGPCITADWTQEDLAGDVVGISVHTAVAGVGHFFARMPDRTWGYWATIAGGGGGPLVELPGDGIVCAEGAGLNLRTEPSTDASIVDLLPDERIVRVGGFVLTEPADLANRDTPTAHGDGWYHVVSPPGGWAYDRYLVPASDRFCGQNWWP
jgi:hypothetical protein